MTDRSFLLNPRGTDDAGPAGTIDAKAEDGMQLFDGGSQFEQITARRYSAHFNAGRDNHSLQDRSDDKGPDPEASHSCRPMTVPTASRC